MSLPDLAIDFKKTLQEFLECREWDDEIEFNESSEEWFISTAVGIGEQSARLIVEGRDSTGIVGIYLYFHTKCKEAKADEMAKLLNWVNYSSFMGNFECLPDGSIRWKLKMDCENIVLTGVGLSQNVQHGWDVAEKYADAIMAVAFTKTSADEIIAEHEAPNDDESDVPDEL
jgi:hypothetical protein